MYLAIESWRYAVTKAPDAQENARSAFNALEQLQRGHLAALAAMTAEQRGQYTRIFGDPLDWVRRRMGA